MKKWNAPEVTELNINETANGCYDSDKEGIVKVYDGKYIDVFTFANDSKKDDNTDIRS